jgi:hypothetical protein
MRKAAPPLVVWVHQINTAGGVSMLELSKTGTYEKYPYREFHEYRARVLLLAL